MPQGAPGGAGKVCWIEGGLEYPASTDASEKYQYRKWIDYKCDKLSLGLPVPVLGKEQKNDTKN